MPLDRTDLALLALLENDARTTHKELAAAVGLAPSSCHARLERLRETGVLGRVTARVDASALGYTLEALVFVQLGSHAQGVEGDAMARLVELEGVVALDHVAGSIDLIVRVVARDVAHLRDLVMEGISALEEVRHVETSLVFEHHEGRALAASALAALDAAAAPGRGRPTNRGPGIRGSGR